MDRIISEDTFADIVRYMLEKDKGVQIFHALLNLKKVEEKSAETSESKEE